MRHKDKKIDLYQQRQITFLLNYETSTFASDFNEKHGPCVSSMGWRVDDAKFAHDTAIERGASTSTERDYQLGGTEIPTILGIGDSNIYLMDQNSLFQN